MSDAAEFPISHIGTPLFVPSLLAHLRNASAGLPIEPVIFQSILICLISGKHLILRTSEEDLGLVVKLTLKTLATVFGLLTHRIRIHKRTSLVHDFSTSAFLRSLFVHGPSSASQLAQDETPTLTGRSSRKFRKRPGSRSRSRSATVQSITSQYTKSVSYPPDLMSPKSSNHTPSLSATDPFGDYQTPGATGIVSHYSLNSASRNSSLSAIPHPTFSHSYSDPTPLRAPRDSVQIQLPDALVISGLENASLPSQRALASVLAEGRVVLSEVTGNLNDGQAHSRLTSEMDPGPNGIWPLPKDFILVYVCTLDERERPSIHKSLLDKFAMSATVMLHPSTRSSAKSFFRPISHRSSPVLAPVPQVASYPPNTTPPFLTQALPHRHVSPAVATPSNGSHAIITPETINLLKDIYAEVHIPRSLNLYISDLFSAARHHHQLEAKLLSIAALNSAVELSRATRVLGGDLTGVELISDVLHPPDSHKLDDISITDGGETDNERLSKVTNEIDSTYVVIDPRVDIEMRLSIAGQEGPDEGVVPILDVTQADIARIVPRVMSHRLRVRDGPEDEILAGAVLGAAFSASLRTEAERGRKLDRAKGRVTVKELLIGILQEV